MKNFCDEAKNFNFFKYISGGWLPPTPTPTIDIEEDNPIEKSHQSSVYNEKTVNLNKSIVLIF